MSSEFARKQRFNLKKIERPIYVRNIDSFFKKKSVMATTNQAVPTVFLYYFYKVLMVCASDKYPYPNVHV